MCLCVVCQVFKKTNGMSLDQSASGAGASAVVSGDEMVKVVNTKYNMSCRWPLSKLKEKLVKLRTLVYAVRMLQGICEIRDFVKSRVANL